MKKKIILISGIVAVLLIAIISIISLSSSFNSNYVFKVGDIKNSPSEYKIYLHEQKNFFEETGGDDIWETSIDGMSAEDFAKQKTINSIVAVKSALPQADKLGITLSDDDLNTIKADSEKFFKDLGNDLVKKFDVTYDDIYTIIKEGQIQKKVFDYMTNGVKIDDSEFKTYFDDYYKTNIVDSTDIKVKYIFKSYKADKSNFDAVKSEMTKIQEELKAGKTFDSLIKKYSESNDKDAVTLEKGVFDAEVEKSISNELKENITTNIITGSKGFYIVHIAELDETPIDEIKETAKKDYLQNKKQELYQLQSENWLSDFPVEKNDELFSTINIE